MGELILLDERRADRSRPTRGARPAFFFDVACPLSYLGAEQVERSLGDVQWVPVSTLSLRGPLGSRELDELRRHAEVRAAALHLPLVWPEHPLDEARCALRAIAHAAELGQGARFSLAACRLAFCGGFDLDDPETLAEAAAAAGLSLRGTFDAAGDDAHDLALEATARGLRSRGITELPAVRVGRSWFAGDTATLVAAAVARERVGAELAPSA